jgi:hypothetical protein
VASNCKKLKRKILVEGNGREREGMPKFQKVRKKAGREKEKRVGRLKKVLTHSERVPEREDPQVEAKKETKARKWIMR